MLLATGALIHSKTLINSFLVSSPMCNGLNVCVPQKFVEGEEVIRWSLYVLISVPIGETSESASPFCPVKVQAGVYEPR